jgi:glutaminyl-tRNA synthetase
MYDFAHGQSDSIEKITHSICTLEFVPHREVYDWCIEKLGIYPSKQYEFARVNVNYTVMSKRKLKQLVEEQHVAGWDDPRMPVVFDPLKVVLTNYPEDKAELLDGENNPEDEKSGSRKIPFCYELYIEQEDFMEVPPKKYFRLAPGQMVRLKSAYIIKCEKVIKDGEGKIKELHCTYIPESKSGSDTSGINVKGTLHWVSAPHAVR